MVSRVFSSLIFSVTERGGADVDSAQVGDALELHFEIFDQQSPYEIFVRDLVAKDGNDNNEIVLIGICKAIKTQNYTGTVNSWLLSIFLYILIV